jgi:hypothetical protein
MPITPEQEQNFIKQNQPYSAPQNAFLEQVSQMPQDQATKVLRLSMQAGIDSVEAARNPNATIQNLIGATDFEDVGKFAPKTYSFLNDPLHMAIARDKRNVMTLADMESENKVWTEFKNGMKDVVRSSLGSLQGLFDVSRQVNQNAPADSITYSAVKNFSAVGPLSNETLGRQIARATNSEALKTKEVKADTQLGQYGLDVVRSVPQIAAQVALALTTGGGGSLAFMGSQIAGSEYLKLRGEGVDTERAFKAGVLDAAAQAPLENLSLSRVLKRLPGASTARQKAAEVAKSTLTEGITEWVQQYPEAAVEIWARHPEFSPEQRGAQFLQDFWEITKEGAYSGLVAAPFGFLGGAVKVSLQKQVTEAFVEHREQQQAILANSGIINVSPELGEKFGNVLSEGEKVFVDPDALILYQSENPDVVEKLGIPSETLIEAAQQGHMVEIPAGTFDAVVAQHPDLQQALKDDIAPDEDGYTKRRIDSRNQKDIKQAQEEVKQQRGEVRTESDAILQQMKAAGLPSDVARNALTALVKNAYSYGAENPAQYLRDNAPVFQKGIAVAPGALNQFAGVGAKTADSLQIEAAKAALDQGKDAEQVRQETGWFKSMDGKWRFEIDDSKAVLVDTKSLTTGYEKELKTIMSKAKRMSEGPEKEQLLSQADEIVSKADQATSPRLGKVLDHPDLYKAYPWIADTKVVFSKLKQGEYGGYDPAINTIEVNKNLSADEIKKTLLHEIQHVIQEQENFARGGSTEVAEKEIAAYKEISAAHELAALKEQFGGDIKKAAEAYASLYGSKPSRAEITLADKNSLEELKTMRDSMAAPKSGETAADRYQRLAGEVEARDTANRADLTAQERSATQPDMPSNAIVVFGGKEFSYKSQGSPKGSIQWNEEGRAIITLFETADPSTVIHEMVGHFFVQNLLDQGARDTAPDWMKKDRQAALDYAGLEDWEVATAEQKREAHEKLARAAEAYIMEGKAPSVATRSMFRKFKTWLTEVYRTITNLGTELKPEIRSVFDRMLATEEEIAQMEFAENYHVRLPQEVLDGLTQAQKNQLDKAIVDAKDEAENLMRGKVMAIITADNKFEMERTREEAVKRFTEEVSAEPLYLAADQVSQEYKKDAKKIAQKYKDGKLPQDQEVHFDYMADLYEFSSGDELATKLLSSLPKDQEVQARVEGYIGSMFKDIMNDKAALEAEAREAMYTDEGLALLAIEDQILQEKLGKIITAEQMRQAAIFRREEAKRAAEQTMSRYPIERAIKLQTYISAERRAAEKAAKAMAKGELDTAQEQKGLQMYNHALVMRSLGIRRQYEQTTKYLKRQQKSKKETWKKEEHFVQAADILRRFTYLRKDYQQDMKQETLEQWATRVDETMDSVAIADWLRVEKIEGLPKNLTIDQLKDVENAIRNIKRLAQTENSFYKLFEKADISSAIEEAGKQLAGRKDAYIPEPEEDAGRGVAEYFRSAEKITTFLSGLDNWRDFGFFHKLIYRPVYDSANELSDLLQQVKLKEQESLNRLYPTAADKKNLNKRVYHSALGASVSKRYLLEMASHLGSESNRKVLFGEAPVGLKESPLWVKKDPAATEANVMAFLGRNLTANDWRWVQNGWDNINSLWPLAQDVHKRMTGFPMDKVEPLGFEAPTADGSTVVLQGGYYPLKEDRRASIRADKRDTESQPLYTETFALFVPKTFTGYTNSRTGASYSIDLNQKNRYKHIQAVAHDIAFRETITDLRRLANNADFKALMERKAGPEGYRLIREFVAAAASPKTEAASIGQSNIDRIANFLRERAVIAALMLNVKTAFQNFANPFLFGNVVDGFTYTDALQAVIKRGVFRHWNQKTTYQQDRAFVFSKSAFMRDKSETPDFILHEFHDDKASVWTKWGGQVLAETDNLTNIPMWFEAYTKKSNEGASDKDAILFADTLIDRTAGSSRKIDTASIMRGNSVSRLFTMFGTFMNTQYNTWAREFGITLRDRDVTRLTAAVASRFLLFSVVSLLLSGEWPDEEDDKWVSKWANEVITYPVKMFPLVGNVAATALGYLSGTQNFGFRLSPVEGQLETVIRTFTTLKGFGEGTKDFKDLAEATTKTAAFLTPFPSQFNSWFWNGYDILFEDMGPHFTDVIKRRPKNDR